MIRHALVEEERWIAPARFNRLLAVLQVLPGPEAHELCVHMGMIARGRWGGLLAGLGFMLPGLLLMLAASWAYVTWIADAADMASVLLAVVALASFAATLSAVPFWVPLILGGLVYATAMPLLLASCLSVAAIGGALAMRHFTFPLLDPPTVEAASVAMTALFMAGLKGGLLTFGGAYTAIPYVRADTVGRGWVEDATFLDGIALAGVLPSPFP